MMAAALAEGHDDARERGARAGGRGAGALLNKMGARIAGAGTDRITIEGVDELHGVDARDHARPHRGRHVPGGGRVTGGDVLLEGARPEHLDAVIDKLREAGVEVDRRGGRRSASRARRRARRRSTSRTAPHPGFPTDMQAQFMVLSPRAPTGTSTITETIFENRFMHVPELARMGADIDVEGSTAVVRGVPAARRARR